ncbi:MAG: hypothetical protein KKC80_05065 [Candidatus Margulisbacteria bacterium]|nr:hypothetical protein [Candidatus Margulisiibacteriota bacterium]MBU1616888.1 hypothetical protein [Candidatus Margulisiibacteriota bacterium]
MKKVLVFILIGLSVVLGVAGIRGAQAATSDSFTITITVGFIGISLKDYNLADYSTWAIGTVTGSSLNTMEAAGGVAGEEGILLANLSNVAIDLAGFATNTNGWSLGSQGVDAYILSARGFGAWQAATYPNMVSAVSVTATSSPGTAIDPNISATTDRYIYFSVAAPTSVSVGGANTITVTLEATAH